MGPLRTSEIELDQAQRTLELAARLQEEARARLTFEDLTRIANEAGIEQRYVEEALRQQSSHPVQATNPQSTPADFDIFPALASIVGYVFANSIINFHWAAELFPSMRSGYLFLFALGLAFFSSMCFARSIPAKVRKSPGPVMALVVTALLYRSMSNYGWDLSLGLHTTLAVIMLITAGVWGYIAGWMPWKAAPDEQRTGA